MPTASSLPLRCSITPTVSATNATITATVTLANATITFTRQPDLEF